MVKVIKVHPADEADEPRRVNILGACVGGLDDVEDLLQRPAVSRDEAHVAHVVLRNVLIYELREDVANWPSDLESELLPVPVLLARELLIRPVESLDAEESRGLQASVV